MAKDHKFRDFLDSLRPHASPSPKPSPSPSPKVETRQIPSLRDGLLAALNNDADLLALPTKLLYLFEDVKPYNLDYPVVPVAVTYPQTAEQVSQIIKYASEANIKVQARGGGHSYANYGIGGVSGEIVIDMKYFQRFQMDTTTWHATIGAGTLLKDLTDRLFANGSRAIAHGTCPQVGVGGHFTVGGFGPTSRLWGTSLDHVIEAEVVLANGSIVRASETENPDVFFAIKGAAAGFGVVTEFVIRTRPAPTQMVRYSFSWELGSFTSMAQTFKNWQKFVSNPNLSRSLYSQVTLSTVGLIMSGTFLGTQAEFDALNIEGIFPSPQKKSVIAIDDWLGLVAHWTEDIALQLVGGIPVAFYSKNLAFRPADLLSNSTVDALFKYIDKTDKGTLLWFLNFELQGGATNDVPANATAYAHRDVLMYMESFGIDIGRVTTTTRNFLTGINKVITNAAPKTDFGSYPGYVDPERVNGQDAYWGSNLPKLERIKKALDPTDMFHNPQSVRPAS